MTTQAFNLGAGIESHTTVMRTLQGADAHSILFDAEARVLNDTNSHQYIGYCITCIYAHELNRLFPRFDENVWEYLSDKGFDCTCD